MPWPVMSREGLWRYKLRSETLLLLLLVLLFQSLLEEASAAFTSSWQNCLADNIRVSDPLLLQFDPKFLDARFDLASPGKQLNITIYGNVTGQDTVGPYPPANDPSWSNPNSTFGKLINISDETSVLTTVFERYRFLHYDTSPAVASAFYLHLVNGSLPLGPVFSNFTQDPYILPAISVSHNLKSSFEFATIAATIRIKSGKPGGTDLACIEAYLTPELGDRVAGLLRYLPVAVLLIVGLATLAAGILSPWGSSDPFKWTTNYGRDQDLLRLVTPGFSDCLHYIQFVFLTASLSLDYPGFYQPAASQFSWSSLAFSQSFLSGGEVLSPTVDGLYSTNGTLGMVTMTQLIGISTRMDLWPSFMVWLAVICATAIILCQLAFLFRWMYFRISHTTREDLRQMNWPLTVGMIIRVVLNFFLLPYVSFSMFQLLAAPVSQLYVVILTVTTILGLLLLVIWIILVIHQTEPRAILFDDMRTLLLYGSLYNTYSDERAAFASVLVALTFMRGIAIGAIQATGIGQLIILAICEVVFILMVHGFRPFSSPTHMNLIHTLFSSVRIVTILLMTTFLPSLNVPESTKGWIGYVILLMHAIVLIFGYFLNSIQTLVEVFARMAGVGGDSAHGAKRGALISYSWRQLKKKQPDQQRRPGSISSNAALLANTDLEHGRVRSLSVASRLHLSSQLESGHSSLGDVPVSPASDDAGPSARPNTIIKDAAITGRRTSQGQLVSDPYYRQPRSRRCTVGTSVLLEGNDRRTTSEDSGERLYNGWPARNDEEVAQQATDDASRPAVRGPRLESQMSVHDQAAAETDYAVREVDFYYGVKRGPALSSLSTRKRKIGPTDPVGPVSNATSWLHRLIGGQKKDKQKRFEVVRSSRAPPTIFKSTEADEDGLVVEEEGEELQTSPHINFPPYHDSPDQLQQAFPSPIVRRQHSLSAGGSSGADFRHTSGLAVSDATRGTRHSSDIDDMSVVTDKARASGDVRQQPYLRPISHTPSIEAGFFSSTLFADGSWTANDFHGSGGDGTAAAHNEEAGPAAARVTHHTDTVEAARRGRTHQLDLVESGLAQPSVPRRSSRRARSRDVDGEADNAGEAMALCLESVVVRRRDDDGGGGVGGADAEITAAGLVDDETPGLAL